jgi:prepilin-type N-terminal cleavage/methylation domain-containing protein
MLIDWSIGEHAMTKTNRRSEAGLTLLEVMIASAVLAIAICGTIGAVLACYQLNTRSREDALALAAAEDIIADVRELGSVEDVVNKYNGTTFTVEGLPRAPGVAAQGEVIVITDETPDEDVYGRNIGGTGVDLNGDGDTLDIHTMVTPDCAFPVDLDGDGIPNNDKVLPEDIKLVPVIVLVRWKAHVGIGRVQLITFVVERDEY